MLTLKAESRCHIVRAIKLKALSGSQFRQRIATANNTESLQFCANHSARATIGPADVAEDDQQCLI